MGTETDSRDTAKSGETVSVHGVAVTPWGEVVPVRGAAVSPWGETVSGEAENGTKEATGCR